MLLRICINRLATYYFSKNNTENIKLTCIMMTAFLGFVSFLGQFQPLHIPASLTFSLTCCFFLFLRRNVWNTTPFIPFFFPLSWRNCEWKESQFLISYFTTFIRLSTHIRVPKPNSHMQHRESLFFGCQEESTNGRSVFLFLSIPNQGNITRERESIFFPWREIRA